MSRPDAIYLDCNATTAPAPEVLEAMLPVLRDLWGNPSSDHVYGQRASAAIERAREQVGELLGCSADEVVFTSGGTESDNAAIFGVAETLAARGRHLVISSIEHPAVEQACARLEQRGFSVSRVGPGPAGRVDPEAVAAAFRAETQLVSIMHANNETGVVQPVRDIADRAHQRGILVHTDAAQSVGKIPVRAEALGVDLLTVAGHKFYAPKGVGALMVRRGTPWTSFLCGAGHEGGRRAGTENTAGIAGLGAACELAAAEMDWRTGHLMALRDRLESALRRHLADLVVHGAGTERLPNTLSAAIPGLEIHALLARLPRVAASAGAACHSGCVEPSRVLRAMGVPDGLALATLRLSVGRTTSIEDVDAAGAEIVREALALRSARSAGPA